MKNNQGHNKNYSETYQKFVEKISKVTKNDNSNIDNQNRDTFSNNNFFHKKPEINMNEYNLRNAQTNDYKQQQILLYEKMNQKLINNRRNADWSQNQDSANDANNNGQKTKNRNEIDSYKVFNDKSSEYPLGGGKNSPIVQLLNQKNYEYSIKCQNGYQDQNLKHQNNIHILPSDNFDNNNNFHQQNIQNINDNNNNYPFKSKAQINNNFNNNNLQYPPKSNNRITIIDANNEFPKKIPEISNQNQPKYSINYNCPNDGNINNINNNSNNNYNNSNSSNKNSGIASSLFYGLIFGSFGTLLLWCKNPQVREYLKSSCRNINTESILNFFKSLLHPIDLIKSVNIGEFKEILKESLNHLCQFIDDYSDLWRLLGIIVMVYAFWLIIKIFFRKLKKNEKKEKKKKIKSTDNKV